MLELVNKINPPPPGLKLAKDSIGSPDGNADDVGASGGYDGNAEMKMPQDLPI